MKKRTWQEQILPLLPLPLREIMAALPPAVADSLEEIRLRVGQPFMLHSGQGEVWLGHSGPVVSLVRSLPDYGSRSAGSFAADD